MAVKSAIAENITATETEPTVSVYLPRLDDDEGIVDQSLLVEMNGKGLRIMRGERVDVPVWAYEILRNSARFENL